MRVDRKFIRECPSCERVLRSRYRATIDEHLCDDCYDFLLRNGRMMTVTEAAAFRAQEAQEEEMMSSW